jgi:sugar transferase (PEP-CTERM/EpsH1 system associated)
MGPIKIVHIVHALDVGGLENGLVNVINNLDPARFSHSIVCLIRSGAIAKRITRNDVEIRELGLDPSRFKFPIMPLVKIFREIRPDIVHTRAWGTVDAIMAARLAGVPRVIHGEHGRDVADPEGKNRKRNVVRKCLSPMVDRFMTVSDDLQRWLTEMVGISAYKVVRIHNGVDTEKFSREGRAAARRRLGLDDACVAIGIVGRLDPVKDHQSLLRAFAAAAQGFPLARLIVVGDGVMRQAIEAQIEELRISDRVQMLGERQDVPDILKALDCFTLTSVAEGISNTILEAMATGLPVVATRVGGNPELVQHGLTGQLVAPGDVRALAQAFETYLNDSELRLRDGKAARERTEKHFSLARMAANYTEFYSSVSAGKSRIAA